MNMDSVSKKFDKIETIVDGLGLTYGGCMLTASLQYIVKVQGADGEMKEITVNSGPMVVRRMRKALEAHVATL
jgi:hypothetical protein